MMLFRIALFLPLINSAIFLQLNDPQDPKIRWTDVIGGVQFIEMDENNHEDVFTFTVVRLTDYSNGGTDDIQLNFLPDNQDAFGPDIIDNGNDTIDIKITKSVDYEDATFAKYFHVTVSDNASSKLFELQVVNIDDEPPSFLNNQPCFMQEATSITENNPNCTYTVQDPDGFLNKMTFNFAERDTGEMDNFVFKFNPEPNDTVQEAQVYLVLQNDVQLDYEVAASHAFLLQAQDSVGHSTQPLSDISIMVQVIDIPNKPPVWVEFSSSESFDEKTEQHFHVSARDGDSGINCDITYSANDPDGFVSVDSETGDITVAPINRDDGRNRVVADITVSKASTCEISDDLRSITRQVTYMVVDVDDNAAIITIDGSNEKLIDVDIRENTNQPLDVIIICNDIDEGENALYEVHLEETNSNDDINYTLAFQIAPDTGYKRMNFRLLVSDPSYLDYEDSNWRTISFQITTVGTHDPTKVDSLPVTIHLVDVDDTDPKLEIEPKNYVIDENQEDQTVLDIAITATDPDTEANLLLTIDWERSTFTKNGAPINDENRASYIEWITVTQQTGDTNNEIIGTLSINEKVANNTPDYELFDTLTLHLIVTDTNTEQGEGTDADDIVITINNIPDNPPVFTDECRKQNLTVNENAAEGLFIGACSATDIDNLGNLTYSMTAADPATEHWLEIDETNGEIRVATSDVIDCDDPLRWYINYTVTVNDGEFDTEQEIAIYIIDVNDNRPQLVINESLYTWENQTTGDIYTFEATDIDRSEPFRTIEYSLNDPNPEISNRFSINGSVLIVNVKNNYILDRDYGSKSFSTAVTYNDNPLNVNSQFVEQENFEIVLMDINNQIPKTTTATLTTSENLKNAQLIPDAIQAQDDDEEGPNSEIDFEIISIEKIDERQIDFPDDLFNISTDMEHTSKKAYLTVTTDLKGFYGTYNLTIRTWDFGEPPNVNDQNVVSVQVNKFNFEPPQFMFPSSPDTTFYLQTQQNLNTQLVMYNGQDKMENIRAKDIDNKFDIKFNVDDEYFTVANTDSFGQSTGQLQITKAGFDTNTKHTLTIVADINSPFIDGEASHTTNITITVGFFDLGSDPVFPNEPRTMSTSFYENIYGMDAVREINQNASYPNVDPNDIIDLGAYYYLYEGDTTKFAVDLYTGSISLAQQLVYNDESTYDITIQASNTPNGNPISNPSDSSLLHVHITVQQVNLHPPVFNESMYYGIILPTYISSTKLVTVETTDEDKGDVATYSIISGSIVATGTGITNINDPFTIEATSGNIALNFQVSTNMKGHFTFTVEATDRLLPQSPEPNMQNHANVSVRIFLVTESNRVNFKFQNDLDKVTLEKDHMIDVLNNQFDELICNIEISYIDPDGNDLANQTITSTYFIDRATNEPLSYDEIIKRITDVTVYSELKQHFFEYGLILMPFDSDSTTVTNNVEVLKAWLIGVSVVLGTLCFVSLISFTVKIRSLNQRIRNLTTTKFGSEERNLNKIGINAPTTNKHAIEGSNPVFNNDIDKKNIDRAFDNVSVASGDSGLIGVEDNPQFNYEDNEINNEKF